MADKYRRPANADYGCSDGGCVFGHPGGMHTNGGCRCLYGDLIRNGEQRRRAERGLHAMRTALAARDQRIAELEQRSAALEAREQSGLMSALGDFLTAKRHEHEAWLAAWDAEWRAQREASRHANTAQYLATLVAEDQQRIAAQDALLRRAEAALAGVLTIANVATDEADVARSVIAAIREQREGRS